MKNTKIKTTTEERLFVYEHALNVLVEYRESGWGLCYVLHYVKYHHPYKGNWPWSILEWDTYPELMKQKPKTTFKQNPNFWWNPRNWKKRYNALVNAINEIKGNNNVIPLK